MDICMDKPFRSAKQMLQLMCSQVACSALTALLFVAMTGAAHAVPAKVKRECRADYKTFCPGYEIGTPKMRACMRSNGRQLSWGCFQALKDAGYVKDRTGG